MKFWVEGGSVEPHETPLNPPCYSKTRSKWSMHSASLINIYSNEDMYMYTLQSTFYIVSRS